MFLFSPRVRVRINALMTLMTLPICTIVGLASKHSLPPSATRAPAGEWPQDPKRPQATTEQQPASSQGTVHGSRHFKVPEGPWTIKNYSIVLQLFGLRWQLQFNKHPQTSINKWIANWNIWNTKWDPSVFAPPPHRSCHLESDHRWSILELCKRGITGITSWACVLNDRCEKCEKRSCFTSTSCPAWCWKGWCGAEKQVILWTTTLDSRDFVAVKMRKG